MDILGILNTIKGKVLDAGNFEFLQNAYEMQTKNIEQLQSNNVVIKESNELLKEKNEGLKQENADLKKRVLLLESELKEFRNSSSTELSDVARAILRLYVSQNESELCEGDFYNLLSFNRVEIDLGVNDLCELDMMVQSRVNMGGCRVFSYIRWSKKGFKITEELTIRIIK